MPDAPHEALHRLFQISPALFGRVCQRVLGIEGYESYEISEVNIDATEERPLVRQMDTVLRLTIEGSEQLLVVEAQLGYDKKKRASWPYYVSYLHARHLCPVMLLVLCNNAAIARWARKPVDLGPPQYPCVRMHPAVLGPDNVPAIVDLADAANDVELTVLSALIHRESERSGAILNVLAHAMSKLDVPDAKQLTELISSGLAGASAQIHWRELVLTQEYPYQSELAEYLRSEGEAQGEANMLLRVLRARGIEVSADAEARIRACTDPDTLATWAQRAVTVDSADEIFG